ncbi:terminase large subunit domain-containing protein [Campylobacter ureolyticus]|uniref:terminase large subunit domain-containing protein n=1 Tax=Campylobacter ureolyticus TaxID=827 RepID=UPI0022B4B5B7|nr:terminase family protein [Campylobacter ureolyticus]MCZ6168613.1 terminase family protein [Campylobacter ureolyticus]
MAYSKKTKDLILNLLKSGLTQTELAAEYKINISTINRWAKALKNEDEILTIDNIKAQIKELSHGKSSDSKAKQIAMLSASLVRLENEKRKIAKVKPKPIVAMNGDYESLKQRALKDGELYEYQKTFLNDSSQFRIVLKSRQIGFSYVSSLDALLGGVAGRNQLFLSASEEQALILMRYLRSWADRLGIVLKKDSEHEITLENDATIKAMPHNFRTVQGFTGDIWMDEFAWYPNQKRIWHAFVPSIGAIKGRLTILSTPFEEHSFFHELFTNETKYYAFSRHRVDIYKAMEDGLDFDLETMKSLFDADTWASAYECVFIDDESALMSVELIKSCVDYKFSYFTPKSKEILYFGYDIGRVKDRSALAGIIANGDKFELAILNTYPKTKFNDQYSEIKNHLLTYENSVLNIDKTGIGLNLAENLYDGFGSRVKGVWFSAPSKEQMALNLKKLFEDKKIRIPNDPVLIADIHSIKRTAGTKNFKYDSPRNENGHADRFWALALATLHVQSVKVLRSGKAIII